MLISFVRYLCDLKGQQTTNNRFNLLMLISKNYSKFTRQTLNGRRTLGSISHKNIFIGHLARSTSTSHFLTFDSPAFPPAQIPFRKRIRKKLPLKLSIIKVTILEFILPVALHSWSYGHSVRKMQRFIRKTKVGFSRESKIASAVDLQFSISRINQNSIVNQ